jgi:hypothetical protein
MQASPTLAAAYAISKAVRIPVMRASGVSAVTAPMACGAGAAGVVRKHFPSIHSKKSFILNPLLSICNCVFPLQTSFVPLRHAPKYLVQPTLCKFLNVGEPKGDRVDILFT